MNDLAEKALQALTSARRQVVDRPVLTLSVCGFSLAVVVVVAGAAAHAEGPFRPITTWLGLERATRANGGALPAAVMFTALGGLVVLWLVTLATVHRRAVPLRRAWLLVAAWTTPFAIGPPLLGTAVYDYAAFGLLQHAGRDPYRVAPAGLGDAPVVGAISPDNQGLASSSGPLGSLVQHLAASAGGGTALGTVLVLRIVGVLAALAIGRLATDLVDRPRRPPTLVLTALNPLVLLHVVSMPHLDGLMVALLLGALVAVHRGRWPLGMALATLGATVLGVGYVMVLVLVVAHAARRASRRLAAIGRDLGVAAVVTAVVTLLGPGAGWLTHIGDRFSRHLPFSLASVPGELLGPVVRGASFDDLEVSGRLTAGLAAVCALIYLLVTVRRRSIDRTAGYALLAIGLLAPATYPWYLLWGVLLLLPTATGEPRVWLLAVTAGGCALTVPAVSEPVATLMTGGALAVVLAAAATAVRRVRRAGSVTGWVAASVAAGDLPDGGTDVGEVDGGGDDRHQREHRDHAGRRERGGEEGPQQPGNEQNRHPGGLRELVHRREGGGLAGDAVDERPET